MIKQFLFENWKFLLFVAFAITEILILIFKKKIKLDTLKEKILNILPLCINYAESLYSGSGQGQNKLLLVLKCVKQILAINNDSYDSFILSQVERILSTPSKKMEKGNL